MSDELQRLLLPLVLAVVAAAPGVLALATRRKVAESRAAQVASETTIKQFNLLYDQAWKQMTDYRDEVKRLREDLSQAGAREDHLESRIARLENQVRSLGETPINGPK